MVDDGGFRQLTHHQRQLDEVVAEAYGWTSAVARDPNASKAALLALNLAVASGERNYSGPGGG